MAGIWLRPKIAPLSYWYVLVEDFETSTPEFYGAIKQALRNRQVPNLEISDLEFPEGGSFSARRQYLRLRRERLIFDICSSSFGTSWFFSCRFGQVPMKLRIWHLLVLTLFLLSVVGIFWQVFGLVWGAVVFLLNLAGILFLLNSVLPMGLYGVDAFLMKVPVLGPFYEIFLRRDTYYRDDTRRMYSETVDQVVRSIVLEVAGTDETRSIDFRQDPPPTNLGLLGRIREGLQTLWLGMKKG